LEYPWPGNIRELKNALERASILCSTDEITLDDLPDRVGDRRASQFETPNRAVPIDLPQNAMSSLEVSLEDLEKKHIQNVLETAETLEEAATILGINLSTLWRKRRRYGLE
jgi:NtrC-family two-component system response regulator AlgB